MISNQCLLNNGKEDISHAELAARLFRATQTEEKLRRENIQRKTKASKTHFEVGKKVRQTIEELGGTMPEDLPTPEEDLKKLGRRVKSAEKKLIKEKGLSADYADDRRLEDGE